MFTIKYRRYNMCETQPQDIVNTACEPVESIDCDFTHISQEYDNDGYMVVYAHRGDGLGMTYGPVLDKAVLDKTPIPRPTVWVMNEHGATVAKYDL